jgi:hypothetical protein
MLDFGTLFYNKIVIITWFGLNENTKVAIALCEVKSGAADNEYKSSPGLAYDSKRNVRNLQAKMNGGNWEGDDFEMDQATGYIYDVSKSNSIA